MTLTIPDISFDGQNMRVQGGLINPQQDSSRTAKIVSTSTNSLYAGTAVKIVSSNEGIMLVEKAAANDIIVGYIIYSAKGGSGNGTSRQNKAYVANDLVDIAYMNISNVMWMTANDNITAGDKLEIVASTNRVITNVGVNSIAGKAQVNAIAGQIFPVQLITTNI